MKKTVFALLSVAALAAANQASAQLIFSEDFTGYTAGDLAGQGGWDVSSANASDKIMVVSGDLNFTGLPAQSGAQAVQFEGAGEDLGRTFTAQATTAGTTLYYSMIVQFADVATFVSPGGYFAHFTEGTTATGTGFRGRLWVTETANAPQLGIDITSGDTPVLASTTLAYDTPIFVVVKLTYNSGTGDDTAQVFINQTGGTEPGTADATDTGVDLGAVGRFGLRQDSAAETPNVKVDRVRVGTTWASVIDSGSSSVQDWSMIH